MFRFTIRDVLWLMVVVGMALGWWSQCQYLTATNRALTDSNRALKEEARIANEESDKAWTAAHDPFSQPNPLDDLWRRRPVNP
jgi:hypothetical protein